MFGWKLVRVHPRTALPGPKAPRRRRRRVTLPVVLVAAAILISSLATADVILTYVSTTSVGNAASPFQFVTGTNYAAASNLGLTTVNGCAKGSVQGSCPSNELTTQVNGVANVGVAVLDVAELENVAALTTTAKILNTGITLVTPIAKLPGGLVCAYAIISDALPTAGATGIPGAPAGCAATEPTLGALAPGCGAGSAPGMTIVDLTDSFAPTVQSPTALTCAMANPTAANTVELYVSFAIYSNAAITGAPVTLNTFGVQVTSP